VVTKQQQKICRQIKSLSEEEEEEVLTPSLSAIFAACSSPTTSISEINENQKIRIIKLTGLHRLCPNSDLDT
jgi:hypothetical protein